MQKISRLNSESQASESDSAFPWKSDTPRTSLSPVKNVKKFDPELSAIIPSNRRGLCEHLNMNANHRNKEESKVKNAVYGKNNIIQMNYVQGINSK